jgi:6-pyruvoyl-tetrahydropterin synthase
MNPEQPLYEKNQSQEVLQKQLLDRIHKWSGELGSYIETLRILPSKIKEILIGEFRQMFKNYRDFYLREIDKNETDLQKIYESFKKSVLEGEINITNKLDTEYINNINEDLKETAKRLLAKIKEILGEELYENLKRNPLYNATINAREFIPRETLKIKDSLEAPTEYLKSLSYTCTWLENEILQEDHLEVIKNSQDENLRRFLGGLILQLESMNQVVDKFVEEIGELKEDIEKGAGIINTEEDK